MDKETKEKANRILAYIDKDRLVEEDPFFRTRILAKTEDYFSNKKKNTDLIPFWIRLRPVLTIAIIALGIFIGIFSGSRLNRVNSSRFEFERDVLIDQFAKESFISELNSPVEEQVLSK